MSSGIVVAQRPNSVDIDAIKNDTAYYYGISDISESHAAKAEAYERLYKNIAVNCNPKANYVNHDGNVEEMIVNIIKTFETSIQERTINTSYTILKDSNKDLYQCVVYIKRSDFREMCKDKTAYIIDYINKGKAFEDSGCYEKALNYYYWGLVLWYSHPYGRVLDIEDIDIETLENTIKDDLRSFNFIVPTHTKIDRTLDTIPIELKVTRNNSENVVNLKCEYYNGKENVEDLVRDGSITVHLVDKNMPTFNIRIVYDFKYQAKTPVAEALKYIHIPVFSERVHIVDLSKTEKIKKDKVTDNWKDIDKSYAVKQSDYLKQMEIVENALRKNKPALAKECFSESGYGMFDTLCGYGKVSVVKKPEYKFYKFNNEVLCRGLSVHFFVGKTEFDQDLVFRFDTESKLITSIAFRLSSMAEENILSPGKRWPLESKMHVMSFMEDYQTAYALKRHKYIESIYSDSALIIVGHVVKKIALSDTYNLSAPREEIERVQKDKKTYMADLIRCFKSQGYIRLEFTDTEFVRDTDNENLYGISVRQEYTSTTYSDVGYLLLMVDLNNDSPIIHVRTWQPDKPEVVPYSMYDFR